MLSRRNVDTDARHTQYRRGCSKPSIRSPGYPESDTQLASLRHMGALEWNRRVRDPCSYYSDIDWYLAVERLRVRLLAVDGCMGYAATSFCPKHHLGIRLQRRLSVVAARFRHHGIPT